MGRVVTDCRSEGRNILRRVDARGVEEAVRRGLAVCGCVVLGSFDGWILRGFKDGGSELDWCFVLRRKRFIEAVDPILGVGLFEMADVF